MGTHLARFIVVLMAAAIAGTAVFYAYPRLDPVACGPGALFAARGVPVSQIGASDYEYRALARFRLKLPGEVRTRTMRADEPGLRAYATESSPVTTLVHHGGEVKGQGLVLLFDNSLSMLAGYGNSDPNYNRLSAARELLNRLGTEEKVTVACFPPRRGVSGSGALDVIAERVTPAEASAALDSLRRSEAPNTPLYDALDALRVRLLQYPERPTVVVLTDGDDNASHHVDAPTVGRSFAEAGFRVQAVGLGALVNVKRLSQVAAETVAVEDSATLGETFVQIGGTVETVQTGEEIVVRLMRHGRPFTVGEEIPLTFEKGSEWSKLKTKITEVEK